MYLYKGSLQNYSWKNTNQDLNNVMFASLCWQKTLLNYLDGLLSIILDEEEIINLTNEWFFHIRDFNKEHVILYYLTLSNISE